MAVDITVTAGSGAWAGTSGNIEQYSYTEEATPTFPHNTAGAVNSLNFSVLESKYSKQLQGSSFRLNDTYNGSFEGSAVTLNSSNSVVSVEAQSPLSYLVGYSKMAPYNGTLGGYLTGIMAREGLTLNIASAISSIPFTIAAYEGDSWELIKQLGAVYKFEIAYVNNVVMIRAQRAISAVETNTVNDAWNVTRNEYAREVSVTYNNDTYVTNTLVWPPNGWNEDTETLTVNAGEYSEHILETETSLISVKQPTPQQFVSPDYEGPDSVYTVAGNDGLPISPTMWANFGGRVSVAINEDDRKSVTVKIMGAALGHLSPFTLSVNSGVSDSYSTLRLVGTGVRTVPLTVTTLTGAPEGSLNTIEGMTLESPAIRTYEQALDAARGLAADQSGSVVTITGDALSLAPAGVGGYQAFGYTAGAIIKRDDAVYRITDATIRPEGITYNAVADTRLSDMNTRYGSMTIAQFNALWTGKTISDFNLSPLGP